MMVFGWGHGKKIKALETDVSSLKISFKELNEDLDKDFGEIHENFQDLTREIKALPAQLAEIQPAEPEESPATSLEDQVSLKAINEEISKCRDPLKAAQLIRARRELRKELNYERYSEQKRLDYALGRRARVRFGDEQRREAPAEEEVDYNGSDVDRAIESAGVDKTGKLDPSKLLGKLQSVANSPVYGGMAHNIAKNMFGMDLDEAIGMLSQVAKSPELSQRLASQVGTGVAGVIKEKITPFLQKQQAAPQQQTSQPQQGQLANVQVNPQLAKMAQEQGRPTAPDGFPLYNVRGRWIDPRRPYTVEGGGM
jgi:hypothetical protein